MTSPPDDFRIKGRGGPPYGPNNPAPPPPGPPPPYLDDYPAPDSHSTRPQTDTTGPCRLNNPASPPASSLEESRKRKQVERDQYDHGENNAGRRQLQESRDEEDEWRRYKSRETERGRSEYKPSNRLTRDECYQVSHERHYPEPSLGSGGREGRQYYEQSPQRRRRSRSRSLRGYDRYDPRNERDYGGRSSRDRYRSRSPLRNGYSDSRQAPREKRPSTDTHSNVQMLTPETAYPLRDYSNYIADVYAKTRVRSAELDLLPVFKHGDGKVNPSAYGSVLDRDLGLCYTTFKTRLACEMGTKCPWRHHPLTAVEKTWITYIGSEKGRDFLEGVKAWYDSPDVPVPGANLLEVMMKEGRDEPQPTPAHLPRDHWQRPRSPY